MFGKVTKFDGRMLGHWCFFFSCHGTGLAILKLHQVFTLVNMLCHLS